MYLRKIFTIALCLSGGFLFAQQQLVSSSGGYSEYAGGAVSYSVGEPVISSHSGTLLIVTQGFQQPGSISNPDAVAAPPEMLIEAYPNPALSHVILKLEAFQDCRYSIYDLKGQLCAQGLVSGTVTEIDLTNLPPSTYLLTVDKNNKELSQFKIIKQ